MDPEQVLYVMPNLNSPCVPTALAHVARSSENMKRGMERLKAHVKQIFISANSMGNVLNVSPIHSVPVLAINVLKMFVSVVIHQDHVIQLPVMNAEMEYACVVKILNAIKKLKI